MKNKISIRQKLFLLSIFILLGSGNVAYITYKHIDKQASSRLWIEHTEQIINNTDNILSLHKDLEVGILQYIITKDSSFLKSFALATGKILGEVSKVKRLTSDNLVQQVRVDSLSHFLHKYLKYSISTIEMRSVDLNATIAHSSTDEDKQNEYHILRIANSIKQDEISLLKKRIHTNDRSIAAYSQYLIAIYIIILTLAIFFVIATRKYLIRGKDKRKNALKLSMANKSIIYHLDEKEQRDAALIIANKELIYQNKEKLNRAEELIIANKELVYQNNEKENRAAELAIANTELVFQNTEKENRAAELIIANKELIYQNKEKEKRAAELIKANQLYGFLSQINQTIVHSPDEETVFKEACRIAVELGKFSMAWIGNIDKKNKKIDLVAQYGMRSEDIHILTGIPYQRSDHHGIIIETGGSYISNDVNIDPLMVNWVSFTAERNWRSCMSLPIKKSGIPIAIFTIISEQLCAFKSQEISLLEESANDISFAVDVFEKEKYRTDIENKVVQNELRLKQAQAVAHFGSWEMDLSTGNAEWSDEFCRIYGLPLTDNRHNYASWASFIHPEDLSYITGITEQGTLTLKDFAYYHRIVRKDGNVRHLYSQTKYELDTEGKQIGLHGVAHDVTEMKESEAERTKITADIVQRNKDLEQFSHIVSHNLRAPVANILGIVNVMQTININKEDEEISRKYLAMAANNLDNVIKDINTILEIENKVNEHKEIVKFQELVTEICTVLNDACTNIKIACDFSAVDHMIALKSYLYSIFFNLISNSIKYKKQDVSAVINISTQYFDNKILIIFKDNGLGIDLKKNGEKVFGLYKRFHDHVDGKGMGLYMVKAQVESLGGNITVKSELDKGTTFTITFERNLLDMPHLFVPQKQPTHATSI